MNCDVENLKNRITQYLDQHPDATSADIADGIDEDLWNVQHAVCYLDLDGKIEKSCRLNTERGMRPGYRVGE